MENKDHDPEQELDDMIRSSTNLINEVNNIFKNIECEITVKHLTESECQREIQRVQERGGHSELINIPIDNERSAEVLMNMNVNFINRRRRAPALPAPPQIEAQIEPQIEPIPTAVNLVHAPEEHVNTVEVIVLDDELEIDPTIYQHRQEEDIIFVGTIPSNIVDLCSPKTPEKTKKKRKKERQKKQLNTSTDDKSNDQPEFLLKCAICMECTIKRKPTTTKCGHVFCLSCITQAVTLTRKCPLCNTKLGKNSFHRIFIE